MSIKQTIPDPMAIALRCYADRGAFPLSPRSSSKISPSRWTLIFDTETRTDAAQNLRFGIYQVREHSRLYEAGVFFGDGLAATEIALLQSVAKRRNLIVRSRTDFIENIFLKYGYHREGTIVGLNLPFDISRIAIRHGSARGTMRGGFTFVLSPKPWHPRIQIKHINSRAALIRFSVPGKQRPGRRTRGRGIPVAPHRGYFVDVKTLAVALTSTSHSLASLGHFLGIEHQKLETDEHGGPLTEEYIGYAIQDVQATWECYRELCTRYRAHGLTETAAHAIKSEAGIGKAYLRQMGILPLRQLQPDFPPGLLGKNMITYYGGRSEVHIRRQVVRVLYSDFLSMYATLCTLMGLWEFVIAGRMTWHDSTNDTRELLDKVTLEDLKLPNTWVQLKTLVRIRPQCDLMPVRAQYSGPQNTIGLNYLASEDAQWFTLADCIATKLLTGQPPHLLEAITFVAGMPQNGLRPISIAGKRAYPVNPIDNDFYRTIINFRSDIKRRLKIAKRQGRTEEAEQLGALQLTLKTLASATSYGIFMETIVEELDRKETVRCYGAGGQAFEVQTAKEERPGTYFHPLLATLITGAARLMLAIAERLASDAGIDWAFCDTDSMALARPDGMSDQEFLERAEAVRRWFDALNPYETEENLFKLEDANTSVDGSRLEPLYCYAVSAKRYVLFNLDGAGRPVIRKASAHGLGHLMAPYSETDAPASIPAPSVPLAEIGVERWQYDLWYQILSAALAGHPNQPDLDFHPALKGPAISRYGASTPALLAWFKGYNEGRPYSEQVRPFGFLTAFQSRRLAHLTALEDGGSARTRKPRRVRPVGPYGKDPAAAAKLAFDRETGKPVEAEQLATYGKALAQYHLHSESKFLDGEYTDSGPTRRRHILATGVTYIGKEANRWEEQYYVGLDADAEISYGSAPEERAAAEERVRLACRKHGQRAVAQAARASLRDLSSLIGGGRQISPGVLAGLDRAARHLLHNQATE